MCTECLACGFKVRGSIPRERWPCCVYSTPTRDSLRTKNSAKVGWELPNWVQDPVGSQDENVAGSEGTEWDSGGGRMDAQVKLETGGTAAFPWTLSSTMWTPPSCLARIA